MSNAGVLLQVGQPKNTRRPLREETPIYIYIYIARVSILNVHVYEMLVSCKSEEDIFSYNMEIVLVCIGAQCLLCAAAISIFMTQHMLI